MHASTRRLRYMTCTRCIGLAGGMVEESAHVGGLIAYLQSLQSSLARRPDGTPGGRLRLERGWLGSLAASVERAMFFEADFSDRWATEALHWLLESSDQLHVILSHWVRLGATVIPCQSVARQPAQGRACGAALQPCHGRRVSGFQA